MKPGTSRLPAPRPYDPRAVRGPGRAREATGRSASRCDGRKRADRICRERAFRSPAVMPNWRPPAGPSRRRQKSSSVHWKAYQSRSTGMKHCKGDHVPTLRPLLAVTGPPRQSGRSPVPWPSAGLQRPRLLRMRHEAAFRPRCCVRPLQYLFYRYCMRYRQVRRRNLLVFAPELLGAHSESRHVRGVGHPARRQLPVFWLRSRSP